MANKTKLSKPKLLNSLNKYKNTYQAAKKAVDVLEKELNNVQSQLSDKKREMQESRLKMLRLNHIGQHMDLSDASTAVLYEGDDNLDVSYVIDGEECVIKLKGEGDFDKISLKEYKKLLKEQKTKDEDSKSEAD